MKKLKDLEKADKQLLLRGETNGLSSEGKLYFENLPPEKQDYLRSFSIGTPFESPSLVSSKTPQETIYGGKEITDLSTILKSGVFESNKDLINFLSKETGKKVYIDPTSNEPVFKEKGTKYKALPQDFFSRGQLKNIPDILESIPSVVAGTLSAPMPVVSVPLTGVVGGGSDMIRQKVASSLLDSERPIQYGKAAVSGGVDAFAQLIPFLGKKVFERFTQPDVFSFDKQTPNKLKELADEKGIQLTPAEQTNLGSLITQEEQLQSLPQTTTLFKKFITDRQQEQIIPNIEKVIANITGNKPLESRYTLGIKSQKNLADFLESLIEKRKKTTAPIYKEAEALSLPVKTNQAITTIDDYLKTAKGNQKSLLEGIKKTFYEPITTVNPKKANEIKLEIDSLQQNLSKLDPTNKEQKVLIEDLQKQINKSTALLNSKVLDDRTEAVQNVKFFIDSKIKDKTFSSLDAKIQGQINQIRTNVTDALQTNPKMRLADQKFAELSKPIDEFKAKLGNVSRTQDATIDNFLDRHILQAEPEQIAYLKNIVKNSDPDLWQNMKGRVLQEFYEKASKVNPKSGENLRIGATFGNLLKGDPNTRKVLKATFEKDEFDALQDFALLLQATGRVPPVGSKTAFNKVAQDILLGPTLVGSSLKKLSLDIFPRIGESYDKFVAEMRVQDIAKTVLSKNGMEKLKTLRKVKPNTTRYLSLASQILASFIEETQLED